MRPRSDRGMSQGGLTAVRLGRYLIITVVAVVNVGRAQVLLGVQATREGQAPNWCFPFTCAMLRRNCAMRFGP